VPSADAYLRGPLAHPREPVEIIVDEAPALDGALEIHLGVFGKEFACE
jgi:hypothetical protein